MNIREAIESLIKAGVSQKEIAHHAGCSQGLISQINTGRTKDTKHSVATRIVELYQARVIKKPDPTAEACQQVA